MPVGALCPVGRPAEQGRAVGARGHPVRVRERLRRQFGAEDEAAGFGRCRLGDQQKAALIAVYRSMLSPQNAISPNGTT